MAIPEYKNGHFEEIAAWSQILQIVGNSTLFYPWQPWIRLCIQVQIYYRIWKYGENLSQMYLYVGGDGQHSPLSKWKHNAKINSNFIDSCISDVVSMLDSPSDSC